YNQPISAIQFYAINAQTLIKESSDIDALDNMSRIEELTKRMASLTNSLRNFAHKPEQKRKKIQISTVIDQLVILMQPRLKTENVELIINHSKHDLTVMAGSTRLTQILSNLIANSIDALKGQSQKTITLEYLANNTETVEIYIKDNGPGIPVDQREKLYEAFYTTKSNQDGLGLGLFIVYNLLNELGGKLDIIDEKDYGAVFRIELERHDQEETNNDRT
ncbi:MAG: sensor histidine kinase, partial [Arenicella sp.]